MGSICKEIVTRAGTHEVWSAIRDIGALHTRLVPGFVTDTRLEPGARIVTFGDGMVLREPIVVLDDNARRLVWSSHITMRRFKSSPRPQAPAWCGLLTSCLTRSPVIRRPQWKQPCEL